MKEIILSMSVIVKDDFDNIDLIESCNEQLEDGWRFDKAQHVVVDRPDIRHDDCVVSFTPHKIVVDQEASVVSEYANDRI